MSVKATFFLRVYNVDASLLRRAVESVLNQTESDIRFIIQDNGSTDGSKEILQEYAKKDKRIDLFRNEINSDVTYEEERIRQEVFYRNVEECQAQYFAIIDADDYYEKNFLELTYKAAQCRDADIVFAGYRQMNMDGKVLAKKMPSKSVFSANEMTDDIFQEGYPLFRTLWGNLYSARLWKRYWNLLDVDRPEYMRNGLDTYINLCLLREINQYALLDECLYTQILRKNSIYKSDVRLERALEGDDLFLQGVQVAQHYKILNEQILSFLSSVYYYHMEDIIYQVLKSDNAQLSQSLLDILQKSDVFHMLAEKGKDFQQLLKILQMKGV